MDSTLANSGAPQVSSAWRETLGGRHLLYGVSPDMCTFAKTISNGPSSPPCFWAPICELLKIP